jgi:hypothetical protein
MNWLLQYSHKRSRIILHATRSGLFDLYLVLATTREIQINKLLTLENTAAFLNWFEQNHKKIPIHKAHWRVLADALDPVSSCISVPALGRRDRQAFVAQRLKTHLPEAPLRYAENTINDPSQVSLIALPDSHRAEHQLLPILRAIQTNEHLLEVVVTPSQLLAAQHANANKTELLINKGSDGTLATICVNGQFRFSRLLPTSIDTKAILSHLRPTLLAHHILTRQQNTELLELPQIYPIEQIRQLSLLQLSAIPAQLLPNSVWLQRLKIHRIELMAAIFLASFVSLIVGYCWLAEQGAQRFDARSYEAPQPPQTQHSETWQQLEAYSQTNTCPNLFNTIVQLSEILSQSSDFSLEYLRWECLHAHQPAQITLNIRIPSASPAPTFALQKLIASLSALGETGVKPSNEELKFIVHVRIPANEPRPVDVAALHIQWVERGLFIPATFKQFQEWLTNWANDYSGHSSPPSLKAQISALLEPSSTTSSSSSDQGILSLTIRSNTEPAALSALESFALTAPALLKLTACEWSVNRDKPEKPHLNTTCQWFWQRLPAQPSFPDGNLPATQNALPKLPSLKSSNAPRSDFSRLGKLFWTAAERENLKKATVATITTQSADTQKLNSHGWIKRSDGMELRWPTP